MKKSLSNDKVAAWKSIAELFLKKDIKVFIKDFNDQYYFGDILLIGEDTLTIQCFSPPDKKDKNFVIYWDLIDKFSEWKSKEEREREELGSRGIVK